MGNEHSVHFPKPRICQIWETTHKNIKPIKQTKQCFRAINVFRLLVGIFCENMVINSYHFLTGALAKPHSLNTLPKHNDNTRQKTKGWPVRGSCSNET